MYSFKTITYGKRPTTIYISRKEYMKIKPDTSSFPVYHKTTNGCLYLGKFRYKSAIEDMIVLRRTYDSWFNQ